MKTCKTCGETKDLVGFAARGLECRLCNAARSKRRYYAKREEILAKERGCPKKAERQRVFKAKNPEYHQKHREQNRGMYNGYAAVRRARLLNATPEWANEEAISFVYHAAQVLKDVYGTTWHVDHKVPLAGADVCGLHIADNLQLLSPTENLRKSNKW